MRFGRSRRGTDGLVENLDDDGTQEEALRVLRSNLQVVLSDLHNPTVLVTSCYAREGKTSTCVPLALSMAAAGTRVVLVDLDLRHPDAHRLISRPNDVGVADVLLGRSSLEEALQFVETGDRAGLYFLPAGSWEQSPAELLGRDRTAVMMERLAEQADIVLVDTPPVLPVADTLVVGRFAAGALLIVEARRTPVPAVLRAKTLLTRNQTRILGLVLNKMRARDAAFTYGYEFQYGYSGNESQNGK